MKFKSQRPIAAALSVLLLFTQVLFANVTESNLWTERLSKNGIVRGVRPGKSSATVIYIEDIHGEPEAQRNIGTMILSILAWDPQAVIGLEGAAGRIPIESFRRSTPEINQEIGSFLLNTQLITGAEYAGFAAPAAPSMVGVEDVQLYRANVEALKKALADQPSLLLQIAEQKSKLRRLASTIYSPRLSALDQKRRDREEGKLSLGDYLQALDDENAVSLNEYPTIALFMKTRSLENKLDFAEVERERGRFLSQLVRKLDRDDIEEITRLSAGHYPDYYRRIKEIAARAGVAMSATPEFERYMAYVLQSDAIRAEQLMTENSLYEIKVWDALCRTEEERKLCRETFRLGLIEKLIRLTMTAGEWKELRNEKQFKPYRDFYADADLRSEKMVQNLLSHHSKFSILVAGGFHSERLNELLAKSGATVITVSPKFTFHGDLKENKYLQVFTREKTSLERIFDGPDVSLAETLAIDPIKDSNGVGMNKTFFVLRALLDPLAEVLRMTARTGRGLVRTGRLVVSAAMSGDKIRITISAPTTAHSLLYSILLIVKKLIANRDPEKSVSTKIIGLAWVPFESVLITGATILICDRVYSTLFILMFFVFSAILAAIAAPNRGRMERRGPYDVYSIAFYYLILPLHYCTFTNSIDWLGIDLVIALNISAHVSHDFHGIFRKDEHNEHYSMQGYEPDTKALNLDGALLRMNKIQLSGPTYFAIRDEMSLTDPSRLRGRKARTVESAQKNLAAIFEHMKKMTGEELGEKPATDSAGAFLPVPTGIELAEEIGRTISILGVDTKTFLLINRYFSPQYGWGFIRASRTHPLVHVSIPVLARLKSEDQRKWGAFQLASKVRRIQHYASLKNIQPELDGKTILAEMDAFDETEARFEWNFLPRRLRWKGFKFISIHTLLCFFDQIIRPYYLVGFYVRFLWLKWKWSKVRNTIRDILTSEEFVDPVTDILDRDKAKIKFQSLREDELKPVYDQVLHLTYLASELGYYDVALEIVDWANYFAVVDSGFLPATMLLLSVRLLVRTGHYDEAMSVLQSIRTRRIFIPVRKKIIEIPLFDGEIETFISQSSLPDGSPRWGLTLTRQFERTRDEGNRDSIMRMRADSTEIFNEIKAERARGAELDKTHPFPHRDFSTQAFLFPPNGHQYFDMDVYINHETVQILYREMRTIARKILKAPDFDLMDYTFFGQPAPRGKEISAKFVAETAYQIALWKLLQDKVSIQYRPITILGAGEGLSAAYFAQGYLTVEQSLRLAACKAEFLLHASALARRTTLFVRGMTRADLQKLFNQERKEEGVVAISYPDGSFEVAINRSEIGRFTRRIKELGQKMKLAVRVVDSKKLLSFHDPKLMSFHKSLFQQADENFIEFAEADEKYREFEEVYAKFLKAFQDIFSKLPLPAGEYLAMEVMNSLNQELPLDVMLARLRSERKNIVVMGASSLALFDSGAHVESKIFSYPELSPAEATSPTLLPDAGPPQQGLTSGFEPQRRPSTRHSRNHPPSIWQRLLRLFNSFQRIMRSILDDHDQSNFASSMKPLELGPKVIHVGALDMNKKFHESLVFREAA